MNRIGRLRRGGSVAVLLLALLLLAPTVGCSQVEGDSHSHTHGASADGHATSVVVDDHILAVADFFAGDSAPHPAHCVVESVLSSAAPNTAQLQLLVLALAAAVVVAAVAQMSTGGIRAPPVTALLARDGQSILTRFCIARR